MARKTSPASKKVEAAMHERKKGTLRSGSGQKVISKKQAIAIGLSEARKEGKKVAPKPAAKKSAAKKATSSTRKAPTKAAAAKGGRASARKRAKKG